ncbi:MAG: DsrE family protein [Desulfobulbaceae bacterium]|nr:DsrE family protein [Desulfobulbaceae bacterium]
MSTQKEKTILFAFRGDPMCFVHVLLNAIDLNDRGLAGEIVIEGEAVKLVPEMSKSSHLLNQLYQQAKAKGLITAVCRACSTKLGVIEAVEAENLPLVGDIAGHPSMGKYLEAGYRIITF